MTIWVIVDTLQILSHNYLSSYLAEYTIQALVMPYIYMSLRLIPLMCYGERAFQKCRPIIWNKIPHV